MTNLFKCFTCGKAVTSEEVVLHECEPMITKYVNIDATSFFTATNEKGEDCLAVDGLDGIGYNFTIKKPNLIPLDELPETAEKSRDVTWRKSDKDGTVPK